MVKSMKFSCEHCQFKTNKESIFMKHRLARGTLCWNCKYCNKQLGGLQARKRHEKVCKHHLGNCVRADKIMSTLEFQKHVLQRINALESDNKQLKQNLTELTTNYKLLDCKYDRLANKCGQLKLEKANLKRTVSKQKTKLKNMIQEFAECSQDYVSYEKLYSLLDKDTVKTNTLVNTCSDINEIEEKKEESEEIETEESDEDNCIVEEKTIEENAENANKRIMDETSLLRRYYKCLIDYARMVSCVQSATKLKNKKDLNKYISQLNNLENEYYRILEENKQLDVIRPDGIFPLRNSKHYFEKTKSPKYNLEHLDLANLDYSIIEEYRLRNLQVTDEETLAKVIVELNKVYRFFGFHQSEVVYCGRLYDYDHGYKYKTLLKHTFFKEVSKHLFPVEDDRLAYQHFLQYQTEYQLSDSCQLENWDME